jgi:hypothetical protein
MFAQDFTRIEEAAGIDHQHIDEYIMGGGAAFFDSNNDGYIDIYITGGELRDKLYLNNQDETFDEVAIAAGFGMTDSIKTNGVCTGDIDNDGDRDVFVTTADGYRNLLFMNNGDGTYSEIGVSAGINDNVWSTSVTMGDYNMDGFLDIYVGNYVTIEGLPDTPFYEQLDQPIGNYFYVNNGDNTFTDMAQDLDIDISGGTLAVTMTDYDRDNDVDIYVANDFGGVFGANDMYRNDYPVNEFTDVSSSSNTNATINAMGIAIGDYNEDQNYDYYISNMSNNVFYKNDGDDTFTNVASLTNTTCNEGVSWGVFFFDHNNDTYLDLYVANGGVLMQDINRNQRNVIYSLDPDFNYSGNDDFTILEDSAISRGAIYGDIDNDGDLDIFSVNINDTLGEFNAHLYRNDNDNGNSWLKVRVQGVENNFDGFGSYIMVYEGSHSYIREIDGGSTYQSQNSSIAHFGLGEISMLDSVVINWLGGDKQRLYDVPSNQSLHIIEGLSYSFNSTSICDGDSTFFGDQWYSESGTYYDTIMVNSTIESIISLSISVDDLFYTETDVTIAAGDSIFLAGEYQTEAGTYIDTLVNTMGCDTILTTNLSIDFSNSIREFTQSDLAIYPNPSSGNFTLQMNEAILINEVRVYSIVGDEVMLRNINEKIERIDFNLSDQSEGIYFISITTPVTSFTKKVILNKR